MSGAALRWTIAVPAFAALVLCALLALPGTRRRAAGNG